MEERVLGVTVVDRQYTWGKRDRWDLLRRKRRTASSLSEILYCLRDFLDPVAIVGGDGSVEERYAYNAFGKTHVLGNDYGSRSASSLDWTFLFHAEFRDTDTGLYNFGYRFYDTELGMWLSRDPIVEWSNCYAICRNSLISSKDYLGQVTLEANGEGIYSSNGAVYAGIWFNFNAEDYKRSGGTPTLIVQKTIEYEIQPCDISYPAASEKYEMWFKNTVSLTKKGNVVSADISDKGMVHYELGFLKASPLYQESSAFKSLAGKDRKEVINSIVDCGTRGRYYSSLRWELFAGALGGNGDNGRLSINVWGSDATPPVGPHALTPPDEWTNASDSIQGGMIWISVTWDDCCGSMLQIERGSGDPVTNGGPGWRDKYPHSTPTSKPVVTAW